MASGDTFPMRCSNAEEALQWLIALDARATKFSPNFVQTNGYRIAMATANASSGGAAGKKDSGHGKAQQHGGFKSGVYSKDKSGCPAIGSVVKKINSKNIWQNRYFYLNNEFLIYKKDSQSSEIKGVLEIEDMALARRCDSGSNSNFDVELVMHAGRGDPFVLRCQDSTDASKWVAAVNARILWKRNEIEALNKLAESRGTTGMGSTDANDAQSPGASAHTSTGAVAEPKPACPVISGWLKKRGKHKFIGQQVLFHAFQPLHIIYYVCCILTPLRIDCGIQRTI
jgi:hypothetical protein